MRPAIRTLRCISLATFAAAAVQPTARAEEAIAPDKTELLGEVIVTAMKRGQQRVLDVPAAISVFSGDSLTDIGADQLGAFIQQAPGVSLIEAGQAPGMTDIQIRGISAGSGNTTIGTATVGYYVDETVYSQVSRGALPDLRTFDLERVEVLRGPQGTLYGAGSIGGVIRLITNDPDLNDFRFSTALSQYTIADGGDGTELNAAVSVPIVEGKLALRLVGTHQDIDGWIDGQAGTITDPLGLPVTLVSGEDLNDQRVQSWRAKALWEPTDKLRVSAMYWDSDVEAQAYSVGFRDRTNRFPIVTNSDISYELKNLTISYAFPGVTLTSSTSEFDSVQRGVEELINHAIQDYIPNDGFSQELRLNSTGEGQWSWTAGVFYQDQKQLINQVPDAILQAIGVPIPLQQDKTKNWAIFGDATYAFNERWKASAGLRYFNDKRTTADLSDPPGGPPIESKVDTINPRFNLSYTPDRNKNLYVNAGRGFRPGVNQGIVSLAIAESFGVELPAEIQDETLWSYELGYKQNSGRVSFEVATYLNKWDNLQQLVFVVANRLLGIVNAGKVESKGVEAAITFEPTEGLSLGLSANYTDAAYQDDVTVGALDPASGTIVPLTVFEKGQPVNAVPKVTANAWGTYSWSIGATGRYSMYIWANAHYRDPVFSGGVLQFAPAEDSLLGNARLGLRNTKNGWSVSLLCNNVSDDNSAYSPGVGVAGVAFRPQPRTIGVDFQYRY